jgi:hypothetical protein
MITRWDVDGFRNPVLAMNCRAAWEYMFLEAAVEAVRRRITVEAEEAGWQYARSWMGWERIGRPLNIRRTV